MEERRWRIGELSGFGETELAGEELSVKLSGYGKFIRMVEGVFPDAAGGEDEDVGGLKSVG